MQTNFLRGIHTSISIQGDTLYAGCENGAIKTYNTENLLYVETISYLTEALSAIQIVTQRILYLLE